jgi:hypothetical protein
MEVLADVYFCVIQQLIQRSKENNNSDDDVAYIYRAIPDYRKITNHWVQLALNKHYSFAHLFFCVYT